MPTTLSKSIIAVKCTTLSDGEYVKVTNLSADVAVQKVIVKSGEAVLNIANLTGWSEGDTISAESQGRRVESSSTTISAKGGTQITLALGSNDDSPAVSL